MTYRLPIVWPLIALGLNVALCGPALPADDDLAPVVRKLVRQLNAPELAQRDEAEQKLMGLGAAALDRLPADDAELAPEVRQRIARVRQTLQKGAASAAGQATLVTLRAEKRPLAEILAEITRQTGNSFLDLRAQRDGPTLSCDFDRVPFWQATDRLLDLAQVGLDPFTADKGLRLLARGANALPRAARAAYCGPFRIAATQIMAQRDLLSTSGGSLQVYLEIAWEPRLRPISVSQKAADLVAVDESGQPLRMENPRGVLEVSPHRGTAAAPLPALLALPPRTVRQIARLQGVLRALLPGPAETFRFERLGQAEHVAKRIAEATVTLERASREGQRRSVEILLRFDRADVALESHRGWIFENQAWLENAAGQQYRPVTADTQRQTENELGMKYTFDCTDPLAECRFYYRSPVLILKVNYPYELKGLDLP